MAVTYRTAPHGPALAALASSSGLPTAASSWWVRRHTARGPQRAHAVKAGVIAHRRTDVLASGRVRWTAQCGRALRSPDYENFEIADRHDRLPAGWTACPTCRQNTEN